MQDNTQLQNFEKYQLSSFNEFIEKTELFYNKIDNLASDFDNHFNAPSYFETLNNFYKELKTISRESKKFLPADKISNSYLAICKNSLKSLVKYHSENLEFNKKEFIPALIYNLWQFKSYIKDSNSHLKMIDTTLPSSTEISSLSKDPCVNIFSFLNFKDLKTVSLVSKSWKQFAADTGIIDSSLSLITAVQLADVNEVKKKLRKSYADVNVTFNYSVVRDGVKYKCPNCNLLYYCVLRFQHLHSDGTKWFDISKALIENGIDIHQNVKLVPIAPESQKTIEENVVDIFKNGDLSRVSERLHHLIFLRIQEIKLEKKEISLESFVNSLDEVADSRIFDFYLTYIQKSGFGLYYQFTEEQKSKFIEMAILKDWIEEPSSLRLG